MIYIHIYCSDYFWSKNDHNQPIHRRNTRRYSGKWRPLGSAFCLHRWPLRSKIWLFNLASKVCAVRSLYWGITMPLQAPTLWIWLGFDKGFWDGERCWDMGHWDGFWFRHAVGRPLGSFRHRNWWSAVLDPHGRQGLVMGWTWMNHPWLSQILSWILLLVRQGYHLD